MPSHRAAIYARISRDPDRSSLGVARQEAECRILATRLEADVVAVYRDDDHSAFSGRPRPEFEQMLLDVRDGLVDLVIAWHPDRLYRRQQDLVPLIETVQAAGAQIATVAAGDLDLSTASGRMTARVVGAVAEHESDLKSERLRAKHDELAQRGRWPSGVRPYGYRYVGDGMLKPEPAEADIVRESARRVLQGESVRSICRDLNDRAVSTVTGCDWQYGTLVGTLTSPAMTGHRLWRGQLIRCLWEPILDEAVGRRLRQRLRGGRPAPSRRPVSLLVGGVVRCGRCGAPLQARTLAAGSDKRIYLCKKPPEGRGCGRLSVRAQGADQAVVLAIAERLSGPEGPAALHRLGHDRRIAWALVDADRRVTALASEHSDGRLSRGEWLAIRRVVAVEQRELRRVAAAVTAPPFLQRVPISPERFLDDWHSLALDDRRRIVAAVIHHVDVRPATTPGFDPRRITDGIVWIDHGDRADGDLWSGLSRDLNDIEG